MVKRELGRYRRGERLEERAREALDLREVRSLSFLLMSCAFVVGKDLGKAICRVEQTFIKHTGNKEFGVELATGVHRTVCSKNPG